MNSPHSPYILTQLYGKKSAPVYLRAAMAAWLFALFAVPITHAKPAAPLTLVQETGVTAHVEQLDERRHFQIKRPDGSTTLVGKADQFEVGDFNFDGLPDLRASRVQGLNTQDQIYLYQPATEQYVLLKLPANMPNQSLCHGLMNTIIGKPAQGEKFLRSSCTLPGSSEMHFEDYRYTEDGKLWLYRQYASSQTSIANELLPYTDLPWGASQKLTVFSPQGDNLRQQLTSRALGPIAFKALTGNIKVYDPVAENETVLFTLTKGQVCQVQDITASTLMLQCQNANGQTLPGTLFWKKLLTTTGATPDKRPFIITEEGSMKPY